ncbi:apolipoprotein N-acyltransferase [Polymorphum gilvum]|uniref:Apolipoprotein N-acyltransferase n=1 Tax=Polymorphum gilvum (strain LMG 25793 / CGMCC 1.9160 / SL003B-26A1) TaxID=991905 RepID=F2IVK9_POLGS|nr:apolipoprotein N-acyltransferase [Polymorphum gilvum]ADZ72727.1 Apolipoprotein N-acyltransferase protein (Acid-inducible gene) [Polymorphum gilvum SL003B-26A1]
MLSRFSTLGSLPNVFLLAYGWRRWGLAFGSGAVSALALPPFGYLPLLLFTLPAIVWLLDGACGSDGLAQRRRRLSAGFGIGWWFGFGYFLVGLWWIGSAFLVEADKFAWMMPFAVTLLPAGLALFHGTAVALAARFWPEGWSRVLLLAGSLSVADWLRGHVLTGFPWNAFGYVLSDSLVLVQSASLIGIYGLGAVVLAVFASPAVLVDGRPGTARAVLGGAGFVLAAMAAFGTYRLHGTAGLVDPTTSVRVIQPSIAQSEKWRPENRVSIFGSYLDLSARSRPETGSAASRKVLVWPESAFPFLLTQEPDALSAIETLLEPDSTLITGAIRAERNLDGVNYYNSIYVISDDGVILDAYDKVRLVPFGEYLPLNDLLSRIGLARLVNAPGAFRAGYRHILMETAGIPSFLPLICYEVIFPQVPGLLPERPSWILNLTNDAWFGVSSGPYQHAAQARLRAIEQGLPLVRSANTGISVVFDSFGRTVAALQPFVVGIIDAQLPAALPPTPYATFGDVLYFGILCIFIIFLTLDRMTQRSRNN